MFNESLPFKVEQRFPMNEKEFCQAKLAQIIAIFFENE